MFCNSAKLDKGGRLRLSTSRFGSVLLHSVSDFMRDFVKIMTAATHHAVRI